MRGFVVLTGMLVAAAVAMLVWLDATGQLRPLLTTTPMVVIELAPLPVPADEPDSVAASADDASNAEAATTAPDTDTASGTDDSDGTTAADFGDGAVALSDVPIADPDSADEAATETPAAAVGGTDAADATGAVEDDGDIATQADAETPPAETVAATEAAPDGDSAAAAANAIAPDAPESAVADAATASAADQGDTPPAKPDESAIEPGALQTAALPSPPRDPNLPWRLYAAPFSDGDPRPRIAIVFTSLGLSDGATEAIIQQLPGSVTLAFSPYSRKLQDWIGRARANGHEVLVELPMEPLNYPDDDPGPLALLSDRPIEDNVTRLMGILDRAEGAVGVAALMGSRFSSDEALLQPILSALGERGFLYVDNGTAPVSVVPALARRIAVPIAVNDQFLDTEASRIAIDARLQQIERIARSEGVAVAFASPYPITIERLIAWIPTLEAKGFVLAPVTATVGHQDRP